MRTYNYIVSALKAFSADKNLSWSDKITIEPPKDRKFGDLATNFAMVKAGEAGKKPRDIAVEIKEVFTGRPEIEKVEIAGPGFVNFTFSPAFKQEIIPLIMSKGDFFGAENTGKGQRVQIEFVSANPTGPLHIGHGRGAAIGDSLARILKFTGYAVQTEYYLNDSGRQMNLLGLSLYLRYREICGQRVEYPEEYYKGEYMIGVARELYSKVEGELLEMPESAALEYCREYAMKAILEGIKKDLRDFRVNHEVWFSEKSLIAAGAVEKTFEFLRQKELAFERDGALWFGTTAFGDDKDRVLRKSDGSLTYFASDVAYHADKFERGFSMVVDVWGADHHGYIPRMKAAVQALGQSPDALQVVLVQLVNLIKDGEQVAMSTRAGKFETLADVVSEVGADAARFIFLSRKSDSKLDFDLDLVKSKTMENPVYYVQYAHARIRSLMRKAEEGGIVLKPADKDMLALLSTPEDMVILNHLEQFPDILSAAAKYLSPHHLSYYLVDLAGYLHRYYTVNPVLSAPEENLVQARMNLLAAVAQVVKTGLDLLGVEAPEKM